MSKELLETICAQNGQLRHLSYHQARLDRALKALGSNHSYELSKLLKVPSQGLLRCRCLYSDTGFKVSYLPYSKRSITSLQLIEAPNLEYSLKYADRKALNALFTQSNGSDDILITQNGFVKETTIANIAFFDGDRWLTPQDPLLEGTTRARLLQEKKIYSVPITVQDLPHFKEFALMNAMIGFEIIKNGIIRPLKG